MSSDQSYRLPRDEEWSRAVGFSKYPWGEQWPPPESAGNYAGSEARDADWPDNYKTIEGYRDNWARTSPVGSFKANQSGLFDMGGNLWEWCEDYYRKEMNSQAVRTELKGLDNDGGGQQFRVLRGGSWSVSSPGRLTSSYRGRGGPGARSDSGGFRVVLVVGGSR